jgi:putative tryptophan/tyrosine transport system substrate-binding protein
MDRRTWFVGSLGLLVAPLAAEAQAPPKTFRIGLLASSSPNSPEASHVWDGFFEGLRNLGYVEGRNVVIEGRFYGDNTEQLPALAAELVKLQVDVIVTGTTPAPEMAKRATSAIPIVLANHPDPVRSGLATSLAKPGGNVTGLSLVHMELHGKQLQLLKEVVPGLSRVAALANPTVPTHAHDLREIEVAARSLKLQLQPVEAQSPSEFAGAFSATTKGRADALMVLGGSMFFTHRGQIAELAAQSNLPAIYVVREYVEVGGLMSYGVDLRDSFRRAATYVDKILKGAKPGDLPIEQPTKFDLAINLRSAKRLRLTIPSSVLARADTVIR